ncbi:MAG: ribonuclease R [Saprospiraceae bacterium]|nr:ribonuclease R [Saprospiraceae bacterium]
MKKKNRKKNKNKSLPVPILEKRLIDLFSKQVTTRFDAKTIIRKLKISNSKDSVNDCLEKLVIKGKLETTRGGKFKWNKNSTRFPKNEKTKGNIAIGRMDVTRRGAAYIVCDEFEEMDKDVFVPAHKTNGGLHGDTVEVNWYISRKGKPEGLVTRIIKRKTEQFIGTLVISRQFAFVVPDNPNMQTDILLNPKKLPKIAEDGAKVVVSITKWHTNNKSNPEGEITTYFGTEGGNDIEMKSILIQKGFNLTFAAEVLHENTQIETEIKSEEIARRRDMRTVTTFTIDPETAKDFDDALSIQKLENGNLEIGIHIADVTHYITPGSELDKEAAKRTTSVYLVDRVLPMLPEKLSNGVCSLRPNEEKLTFSAVFEIDMQGDIINEWFGKTVIYSDRRFTYEEAQSILNTNTGDYSDELKLLNYIAYKLRKKRFSKGAINFESPEVRFKLDDSGKPLEVYLKSRKDAHMLVEDFMLLANKRVGALIDGLHEKTGIKWPMIYRIHDQPNMEKVEQFAAFASLMGYPMQIKNPEQVKSSFGEMLKKAEGKPEQNILQQLAIRTMAKAVYSTDNIGHYGLGFLTYSHFTSPIRRYADVLAHRILFDYLCDNNKRMNPHKLEELCKHISKKERDAMEAERESTKYKQAEFIESHIEEIFEGSINGITEHGIYVLLKTNFCEGMIRYNKMYDEFEVDENMFYIQSKSITLKMGDSVWVRVLGANKYKKQIDLELLDPENIENKPPKKNSAALEIEKENITITEVLEPKAQTKVFNKTKVVQEEKHKSKYKTVSKANRSAQNKAFESILPQVSAAYQDSDILCVANKKQVKWKYELSPSSPIQGSILLLYFNPMADKGKGYREQKLLSHRAYEAQGNLGSFFQNYFPDKSITKGYLSPFRCMDEKQLSEKDLDLSLPIFSQFIDLLIPSQIISFSNILLETLQSYGLIDELVEEEITHNERTILVSKGKLCINGDKIQIFFVPKPSARIAKELKVLAWDSILK